MIRLTPDFLNSDKEYNRYHHFDISDLPTPDLLAELNGIRCQVWLVKSGRFGRVLSPFERGRTARWLNERISRIEAELRKRRGSFERSRNRPRGEY